MANLWSMAFPLSNSSYAEAALHMRLGESQAHRESFGSIPHPRQQEDFLRLFESASYENASVSTTNTQTPPDEKFEQLKKSVEQIEAIPFESGARKRIEGKIGRLQKAGAVMQAATLEAELTTRNMLVRLKEWDYKLLTKKTIDKFQSNNKMTLTTDGLKVHIDPIAKYCGNPQVAEAKDRIIPDRVLDSLETAKERELFDEFAILWAEKVKDPLLLGIVHGCEDYFFIAEWGTDITFEQITKGE